MIFFLYGLVARFCGKRARKGNFKAFHSWLSIPHKRQGRSFFLKIFLWGVGVELRLSADINFFLSCGARLELKKDWLVFNQKKTISFFCGGGRGVFIYRLATRL